MFGCLIVFGILKGGSGNHTGRSSSPKYLQIKCKKTAFGSTNKIIGFKILYIHKARHYNIFYIL